MTAKHKVEKKEDSKLEHNHEDHSHEHVHEESDGCPMCDCPSCAECNCENCECQMCCGDECGCGSCECGPCETDYRCHCPHHSALPMLGVVLGLAFLLNHLGWVSDYVLSLTWPVLIILACLQVVFAKFCRCCGGWC